MTLADVRERWLVHRLFLENAVFISYNFWPRSKFASLQTIVWQPPLEQCLGGGESWPSRSGGAEGGPHQAAERVQDPSEGKAEVSTRRKCFLFYILCKPDGRLSFRVLRTISFSDWVLLVMTFSGEAMLARTSRQENPIPWWCIEHPHPNKIPWWCIEHP